MLTDQKVQRTITLRRENDDWLTKQMVRHGRWPRSVVIEQCVESARAASRQESVGERVLVELQRQNALLERLRSFLDFDLWTRFQGLEDQPEGYEAWLAGMEKRAEG